jgi:NAD-dependent SIR2 family protein deacetylase
MRRQRETAPRVDRHQNILPDSRAHEAKNVIRSPFGNLIICYCANCGCEWGRVREEEMTFAFVLCNKCAETMGPIAGMMAVPDEVFFERVRQERETAKLEDPVEFVKALADPSTPLGKLAVDWQKYVTRGGQRR